MPNPPRTVGAAVRGDRLLELLRSMPERRASDLFLHEGRPPALRVDGALVSLDAPPVGAAELRALLDFALRPGARQRLERTGDVDAGFSLDADLRFRLAVGRERGRLAVVARLVPPGDLGFDELGLPPAAQRFAEAPRGLVLVTGATGSGKSTTLAAMVHHVNRTREVHVVTIEDPIEFLHRDLRARITQREVGADTASFAAALRHVVRQSPDVIVIGEMRDAETIRVAISAALTGHLVLATLHTVDAVQTLQRVLAYFPDAQRAQVAIDLSLCLVGILSQRLLPRSDGGGRVAAVEVLTATPAVRRLLREQRVDELSDLLRDGDGDEVCSFDKALVRLHRAGVVDFDVALAHASNPDEFSLAVRGMATGVSAFRVGGGEASGGVDLRALLREVVERGASDLHVAVGRPPILRISGELVPLGDRPLGEGDVRGLLNSVLTARQRAVFDLDREIDFALQDDDGRRFRVNAYHQKGRVAMALRAIPRRIPSAEELGLPDIVLDMGGRPQGLFLAVGPTGSGKSTTLACLLDRINHTRACRVITIEDPIEYVHESVVATVDQREVYSDTRSFAAALKYVLRQDPDVILVGEMRDPETIAAALTAAETGHLVLATLHANDAVQAIDRIVDVFPPHQQRQVRMQLAACLLGVANQRLLPRADGRGRVAAFEVMVATSGIRALIRDGKSHQVASLMEAGMREGCITMDRALRDLVEAGIVERDDALRFATSPRALDPPGGSPYSSGRTGWR